MRSVEQELGHLRQQEDDVHPRKQMEGAALIAVAQRRHDKWNEREGDVEFENGRKSDTPASERRKPQDRKRCRNVDSGWGCQEACQSVIDRRQRVMVAM